MTSPSPASVEPITVADRENLKKTIWHVAIEAEARVVELEAALAAAIASQRPWSDKFAGEVIDKQVEIIKGLELRAATSEARATALLEALRPFGTLADSISPSSRNEAMLVLTTTDGGIIDTSRRVSVGHLRAARATINAGASNDRK